MNFIYATLVSLLFSLGILGDVPYASIDSAFESNNPNAIVALGKSKILINVLGKEGVYSQSQAALVLKDFFNRKPGSDFNFYFKGKETADGTFAIGNYMTKGEKFRITIHFKTEGDQYKIESLRIEED